MLQLVLEYLTDQTQQQSRLHALEFKEDCSLVEVLVDFFFGGNSLFNDWSYHLLKELIERKCIVALSY